MQGTSDFLKSLPWLALKTCSKKLSNYQLRSFHRNIVILGVKIARVTRALGRLETFCSKGLFLAQSPNSAKMFLALFMKMKMSSSKKYYAYTFSTTLPMSISSDLANYIFRG